MTFDLDRYCERVGLDSAPRIANDDALQRVCFGQATRIPFENLDIHRGVPISIEPDRVFEKLVVDRRGGYCFEQNTLLLEALRALGFVARPLAARVLYGPPATRPRTHMLVLVESGGHVFLADAGFGTHNLLGPLIFEPDSARQIHGETYRIRELPWDGKVHAPPPAFDVEVAGQGDAWIPLYRVSLEHQERVDFAMASWFTSTHPDSLFVTKKVVSRPEVGARRLLVDRELTIVRGSSRETRSIADEAGYRAVLADTFGIQLPAEPTLRW